MTNAVTDSPCIGVCLLDEQDLCVGCRRTVDEITHWATYTDEQREETLQQLEER